METHIRRIASPIKEEKKFDNISRKRISVSSLKTEYMKGAKTV